MLSKAIRPKIALAVTGFLLLRVQLACPLAVETPDPATGLVSSKAVVANLRTGKVYAVDPDHNAVVVFDSGKQDGARVSVGQAPVAIAVNEATNRIYVANAGGDTVSVMDGESDTIVASVKVGQRPYAIAANPATNKVYVSIALGNTITVIDGATNSPASGEIVNADSITIDAKLDKVYLAGYEDTNLTMVDSSPKAVAKIAAGIHLWGIAVNEATHTLYATRSGNAVLVAMDEASGAMKTAPVGRIPCAIAVNPATNMVYVVNHGDDTVTVVDGAKNAVVATLPVGSRPQGIAVDPMKNLVYVANKHSDSVTVIDGAQNRVTKSLKTGKYPYALAVDPPSGTLYVALEAPTAVEVIDPAKAP